MFRMNAKLTLGAIQLALLRNGVIEIKTTTVPGNTHWF